MIIVDIEVPILGKSYDFQIDENVPLCEVKEEMIEMICRKEQCEVKGDKAALLLWDAKTGRQLIREQTARENGLITGSRIMMV